MGLRPKQIWKEIRIDEIYEAMERCTQSDKEIPQEWIDELAELRNRPLKSTTQNTEEERDWEILSFKGDDGVISKKNSDKITNRNPDKSFGGVYGGYEKDFLDSTRHSIHSVKIFRPDELVLTIDDITNEGRITGFKTRDKLLAIEFEGGSRSAHFAVVKKVSRPPIPEIDPKVKRVAEYIEDARRSDETSLSIAMKMKLAFEND